MTKRRKPRAPKVSGDALTELIDGLDDKELWALANRFEVLEKLLKSGVLNKQYVALEAIGALTLGLVSGRSEEQLKTTWPKDWGTETATVPLALLREIASAWADYRNAPTGKSMGESFKIEGRTQGAHRMRDRLATVNRTIALSNQVVTKYLESNNQGVPLRLEDAKLQVAHANGVSFQTVEDAYDEWAKLTRQGLSELGIIEG